MIPQDNIARTTTYDAASNTLSQSDAYGQIQTFSFSPVGPVVSVLANGGAIWTSSYDGRATLVQAIDANATRLTMSYDARGRCTATSCEGGQSTNSYDGRQLLISVLQLTGSVYTASFDARRSQVAAESATSIRTSTYDGRTQSVSFVDVFLGGGIVTTTFDGARNPIVTFTLANRTSMTHDPRNLLTQEQFIDGTVATWVYDAAGNSL